MTMTQHLAIAQDMTIYHVLEQKQTLLDALNGNDELELDLSGVGEIDSAGLQLLILVKREARKQNKRIAIVAHSQSVREVIDFCNVASELGDPLVIPAREAA